MADDFKTVTKEIIDTKTGRPIGTIIGRREEVERYSNRDLSDQLNSDRAKHKERLRDK